MKKRKVDDYMKYKIVDTFPHEFFENKQAPLISLYQETSRHLTQNKRDSLIFKNLIKEVEMSLKELYSVKEIKNLMDMLTSLENESTFWSRTLDGIALFATLDDCIIYHLKKTPQSLAIVADSFHIKPLIEYFQLAKSYQVLALDAKSFKILEGNFYQLEEKELDAEIPTTMDDILGTELTESYVTRGSYAGASGKGSFHGHGGKQEEIDIDLERYFRRVDALVDKHVSKVSKMPMILLAPKEYHSAFLKSSNNAYMTDEPISGTYESMDPRELMKQIKAFSQNKFNAYRDKLIQRYNNLRLEEQSSDQLIDIISATVDGRVQSLLIEKNKLIPGKIDVITKKILIEELSHPEFDDILDDLAQLTLEKGGEVLVLTKEEMPTKSGTAAIYRY